MLTSQPVTPKAHSRIDPDVARHKKDPLKVRNVFAVSLRKPFFYHTNFYGCPAGVPSRIMKYR